MNQARSVHEQCEDLAESASAAIKQTVKTLDTRLAELLGGRKDSGESETKPALSEANTDVIALYKEVEKADGEPTRAQIESFELLDSRLSEELRAWNQLKADQLAKLNQQLRSAGQKQIRLDLPPREPEHAHNEE